MRGCRSRRVLLALTLMTAVTGDHGVFLHIGDVNFTITRATTQQNRVILQIVVHEDQIAHRAVVMAQFDLRVYTIALSHESSSFFPAYCSCRRQVAPCSVEPP